MKESLSYQAFKKSPYSTIKHTTYFQAYDDLFSSYRGKEITFVEVGVLGGGSLFMWRDFFGPKARIIGIDLNPNAKKWEDHGFEIFIGSQSDQAFWKKFSHEIGPIDIVLDDGGHTYEQQIITTESLLGNIKDGGMIVVEDTHTSYMDGFGPKKYSFVEYTKNIFDNINQRFGKFSSHSADQRIWSIEIFESIVAFKINKKASSLTSELTDNTGINDHAEDFRYSDNAGLSSLTRVGKKFRFLKNVPGVQFAERFIRGLIVSWNFKAKKYFN